MEDSEEAGVKTPCDGQESTLQEEGMEEDKQSCEEGRTKVGEIQENNRYLWYPLVVLIIPVKTALN